MWERNFRIADQGMIVKGKNPEAQNGFPDGFGAFEEGKPKALPLLTVETGVQILSNGSPANYTFQFEELDLTCEFAVTAEQLEFRMLPNSKLPLDEEFEKTPVILKMPRDSFKYLTNLLPCQENMSQFNFLLWNAYTVASACQSSVAIHSSVVICQGKTVLFLGESGTGKSTHAQLWLRAIAGSKLLNDDSPIVRIPEKNPVCYGSPWSGKGNCYKNESYPIAAIVRLRQSSSNRIYQLNKIEAFSALYPSCPPSFSTDSDLTDHICNTLSTIIEKIPVYTLECLPDVAAAQLSCSTIFGNNRN